MYITSRVDLCRVLPPLWILAPDLVSYRVATSRIPIGSRFFRLSHARDSKLLASKTIVRSSPAPFSIGPHGPLWWLRRSSARRGDQLLLLYQYQECWLPHLPPIQQEHDGKTWGWHVVHIRETTRVSSSVEINPGFAAGVGFNADLIHRCCVDIQRRSAY